MKPVIGQPVQFCLERRSECRPIEVVAAIVTHVHADGLVNLACFYWNVPCGHVGRQWHVKLFDPDAPADRYWRPLPTGADKDLEV